MLKSFWIIPYGHKNNTVRIRCYSKSGFPSAGYQKSLGVSCKDSLLRFMGEIQISNELDFGDGIRPRRVGGKQNAGGIVAAQYFRA